MSSHDHDEHLTALALAARDGDRAAAAEFVAATQGDVIRYIAHLAGADLADDLAQDTFIRFMKALPGYEGRSCARVWLLSIARHTVLDHLRLLSRRPRGARLADPMAAADCAAAHEQQQRFEDRVMLERLIAALHPDRREAFVTTQILGLSYEEAAEVLGCPVGTIRSRVSRARADLVTALAGSPTAKRGHLRAV